jgi:hypothetical protein
MPEKRSPRIIFQGSIIVGFVLKVSGSNLGRLNEDKFRVHNVQHSFCRSVDVTRYVISTNLEPFHNLTDSNRPIDHGSRAHRAVTVEF